VFFFMFSNRKHVFGMLFCLTKLSSYENLYLQEAKNHAKAITRLDLHGYYRTQGIIKYLEQDMEACHIYMKKADKELKSAEKSEIGYLQLDREWFEQLKERVSYDG
ncbi:hypothetical protein ABEZ87_17975, partial [Bacillus mycoides]